MTSKVLFMQQNWFADLVKNLCNEIKISMESSDGFWHSRLNTDYFRTDSQFPVFRSEITLYLHIFSRPCISMIGNLSVHRPSVGTSAGFWKLVCKLIWTSWTFVYFLSKEMHWTSVGTSVRTSVGFENFYLSSFGPPEHVSFWIFLRPMQPFWVSRRL